MKIVIRKNWNRSGYSLWFYQRHDDGHRFAKPLRMEFSDKVLPEICELPEPTIHLRQIDIDSLKESFMSEMQFEGLAPIAVKLDGELKATKDHLKDLQKIVFDSYGWSKNK